MAHIIHTRNVPGPPRSGDQGDCTIGSHRIPATYGHPTKTGRQSRSTLHIQKKSEKGSLNEETKKHALNEITGEISRKRAK